MYMIVCSTMWHKQSDVPVTCIFYVTVLTQTFVVTRLFMLRLGDFYTNEMNKCFFLTHVLIYVTSHLNGTYITPLSRNPTGCVVQWPYAMKDLIIVQRKLVLLVYWSFYPADYKSKFESCYRRCTFSLELYTLAYKCLDILFQNLDRKHARKTYFPTDDIEYGNFW